MNGPLLLDGPAAPALGATILIVVSFIGLGRLLSVVHSDKSLGPMMVGFDLAAGWGVATTITVIAALFALSLAPVAAAIVALGIVSFLALDLTPARRGRVVRLLVFVLLLCLPLMMVAAAASAIMYDEFGHWLSNARFVYSVGALPSDFHPNRVSDIPAYPYGGPFIDYFASLIASQWLGAPVKLFTITLFAFFGVAFVDAVQQWRDPPPRLGFIAGGIALATFLNPSFDPRIALTAYMDSPSGALLGLLALATWRATTFLTEAKVQEARQWFRRGGYTALAMVVTRDTNLVLLGGLGLGLVVAGAPMLYRRFLPTLQAAAALFLIPAVGFSIWRLYRVVAALPPPLGILPFNRWQWDAVGVVVTTLFTARLAQHPILGGFALFTGAIFILIAAWTWRHGAVTDRHIIIITAVTSATWLIFLAWAYIATMTPSDVGIAISFWRYLGQLGLLLLVSTIPFLRHAASACGHSFGRGWKERAVGATAIVVVLGTPFVLPSYLRNDCNFSDVVAARRLAVALASDLAKADWVFVIHTQDAPWLAIAIAYQLELRRDHVLGINASQQASLSSLMPLRPADQTVLLLDLRALDRDQLHATGEIPAVTLYRRINADSSPALASLASVPHSKVGPVCSFPWRLFED